MTTDQQPLTCDDYIDAAESAERGEAWPQAATLWRRAAGCLPKHPCERTARDRDTYLANAVECDRKAAINERLEQIALRTLRIPTLAERHSDGLDFHEFAVWQIKNALKAAYEAGQNDAK